jgi:preprotein translocase subunit SecY
MLADSLKNIVAVKDLRNRVLFTLGLLAVYRVGGHIPTPGVNSDALKMLADQAANTMFGLYDMFSGKNLSQMTIFALGIMPYISASIILQLLTVVWPYLERLSKEGELGRRKITQYTRYGTILLSVVQSLGIALYLEHQTNVAGGLPLVYNPGWAFRLMTVITLTTGTGFIMWLGEQITERGIGNGISMIILSGIVAGLPGAVGNTMEAVSNGEMPGPVALALLFLVVGVTAFVVFMERAQRRIPVDYAKRQVGRRMYAGQSTHLPFKINMSGVIPPIFASSLLLFPATLASFFGANAEGPISGFMQDVAAALGYGQPLHLVIYAVLIIFFCFFYTALVFNARDTAENLKKSGAFVRGIRPGQQTAEYIDQVLTRLTLWGALYVTAVCLVPEILISWYGVPFRFGGTSLLIVVVVVMDFMSQLNAHMMSHHYPGLLKKANLLGYGRTGPGG